MSASELLEEEIGAEKSEEERIWLAVRRTTTSVNGRAGVGRAWHALVRPLRRGHALEVRRLKLSATRSSHRGSEILLKGLQVVEGLRREEYGRVRPGRMRARDARTHIVLEKRGTRLVRVHDAEDLDARFVCELLRVAPGMSDRSGQRGE